MKYLILGFLLCVAMTSLGQDQRPCNRSITGKILDINTNEPLPFATIQIKGSNLGAVADENGAFTIENICKEEVHLEVRFLGYKTVIHHHDFHHASPMIYLASDQTMLESVIVEEVKQDQLQSISVNRKDIDKLSVVGSSIGDLTGEISGVSMLQTGTNISKPMVHGLHSNRVLVINNGVRHAYQVWGQEHAPEIDPSHVDQIEIVKGASTVKYGPDALGGVILYNSKKPVFDKELNGSVSSSFQTNGKSITSQVSLGQGFHRFAWDVGGFGTYQGDLEAPDYTLSNTGKREYGASFNTLLHRPIFDLQVSGSYFHQDLGILRGSIVGNLDDLQRAIERSTPSPTFSSTYDIQNPRQKTNHGVIKSDLSLFVGDHAIKIQYAFQHNTREEFDVRRGELNDRPVIDLTLTSQTIDTEWTQPEKGNWNGSSGIQIFTQNSVNRPGSNPVNFVPDYDVFNIGAFTVQSLAFDRTTLELGLRFDYQSLDVSDVVRDSFTYSNNVTYANGTFTFGLRKEVNDNLSLFTNLGSAWRAPNVAELYSFGYHNSRLQFGLWRYELEPLATPWNAVLDENDRPVDPEHGFKWVSGIELKRKKIKAEFILFLNQINNYIFQRPYGISTGIAGTFPYFFYDQTDALFIGSDWDIQYQHTDQLTSEIKVSYVYATGTKEGQALLEVPPFNVNYQLDYKTKNNWSYGIGFEYTATQWNAPPVIEPASFQQGSAEIDRSEIFDFMSPPKDFLLIDAEVGYKKNNWNALLQVNNLLNTSYRQYTDRLRYFADAPGINFSIALEYKF
ncbi:TonB-dependent receptor [Ekhidna sp.]|uniref:TonB-dependent receptor n=1 Tax=Ekhidna sp. TaxID=2608089 RepID=UPI003C7C85B1